MLSTCVLRLLSATTIGDADAELCSIGELAPFDILQRTQFRGLILSVI